MLRRPLKGEGFHRKHPIIFFSYLFSHLPAAVGRWMFFKNHQVRSIAPLVWGCDWGSSLAGSLLFQKRLGLLRATLSHYLLMYLEHSLWLLWLAGSSTTRIYLSLVVRIHLVYVAGLLSFL